MKRCRAVVSLFSLVSFLFASSLSALDFRSSGSVNCPTVGAMLQGGLPSTCTVTPKIGTSLRIQSTAVALGPLHIGDTENLNSANPGVLLNRAAPNTGGGVHGFADNSTLVAANIGYNSFDARMNITQGAAMDHYAGFQSYPNFNSTNGVGSITGYVSLPTMAAGNATAVYHFQASETAGAGTVGSQYGLYIGALTKGTNNYALWSDGTTQSKLGGRLGIGAAAASTELLRLWSAGAGGSLLTLESSDTLGAVNILFKTNTVMRYTVGHAAAGTTLQFTDAAAELTLALTQSNNVGVGIATFGTSAVGVVGIKSGTCGTSSPADYAELCVLDVSGAGTAGLRVRGELGDQYFLGNNHFTQKQTTAPTVSATNCGTTPVIAGVDQAFRVTVDFTGAAACVVTFNKAFANAPLCHANNETTANLIRTTATVSNVTISGTVVTADKLTVMCQGYET